MQKAFAPAASDVAELIKEALSRGHTVIVPAPACRSEDAAVLPHTTGSPLTTTCRLLFGLSRAEGRALAALMEHDHVTTEQLHAAMSRDGNPVSKIRTVSVIVCNMRKKLAPHGIAIATVHELGFRLAEGAREKLRKLLTAHDAGLIPTIPPPRQGRPRSKAEAPEPDMNPTTP